ncbi:membrane protein insertion efficiency factor YidD [candidate division WOR-3 bacterium]|nr:membrane protein insertion efficiency factor YidD [candidate division WOR-3 bacterium]
MLKTLLKLLIRLYQWTLGTVLPNSCRFYPTCSHYALEALEKHGAGIGIVLAVRRVLRCHPFSPGGYDPVPEKKEIKGVKK